MASMYGYQPCPECGVPVQRAVLAADEHACDPHRHETHQAMLARRELKHLEDELSAYLLTPQGRFQKYLAIRDT